jgi:hypothetical protein
MLQLFSQIRINNKLSMFLHTQVCTERDITCGLLQLVTGFSWLPNIKDL